MGEETVKLGYKLAQEKDERKIQIHIKWHISDVIQKDWGFRMWERGKMGQNTFLLLAWMCVYTSNFYFFKIEHSACEGKDWWQPVVGGRRQRLKMQIDFRAGGSISRVGGKFPVKNMSLGIGQWVSLLGPNFVFHSTMLLWLDRGKGLWPKWCNSAATWSMSEIKYCQPILSLQHANQYKDTNAIFCILCIFCSLTLVQHVWVWTGHISSAQ